MKRNVGIRVINRSTSGPEDSPNFRVELGFDLCVSETKSAMD